MSTFAIILGLCILGVATASALATHRRENHAMRQTAARCGLSFCSQDVLNVYDRYYRLAMMRQGHQRAVWNLLYGSTEVGAVALFSYRYEVGLGVRQEPCRQWVGVLETSRQSDTWQLGPEALPQAPAPQADRLGKRCLLSDRPGAAERLRRRGMQEILRHAAPADHFEAQPGLLAVATPHTDNDRTPARLLQLLKTMGLQLEPEA